MVDREGCGSSFFVVTEALVAFEAVLDVLGFL